MPWHRDQPWHRDHESVFAAQGGNLVIHPRPPDAPAHAIRIEPGPDMMSHPERDAGGWSAPASITQTVQAEAGYAYGVINADLHVLQDRGPVYLLAERQPAPAPVAARLLEQPSHLLNARYKVVAFTGRELELAELCQWRDTGSRLSIRWLYGPGGAGKTRLAEAFADACAAARWKVVTALYVPGSVRPSPGSQDLRIDQAAGLLLVVDYADRWPLSHLSWLLSNALLHHPDLPARVLLLARSAYAWPAIQAAFGDLLTDSSDQLLAPLPGEAESATRQRMFTAARDAFADRYGLADPARITPPPHLAQPDFGLTLTVHMAALVAVDALARGYQAPTDPAALSVYLLNREHGHWRRLHESRIEGTEFETPPSVMARVVFAAALTGGTDHGGGSRLLRTLGLPGHPDRLLGDHGLCYPAAQPGMVLEPLYPDRLAEDFLALTLPGHSVTGYAPGTWATQDTATLILGEGGGDGIGSRAPYLGRAMTFLAAAAAPGRWPHVARHLADLLRVDATLAAAAGGGALAALADLDDLDPDVLAAVAAHLPERPQVDLDLGIAALTVRLTNHRLGSTTDPVQRAQLYTTLAQRSANAGLYQQAADAAGEATAILSTPAPPDTEPAGPEPDLAAALYEQCRALAVLGRRAESLAAIEQATATYRSLAAADPAYLPQLAASLYLLGRELSDPGQMQQAIAVAEESVTAYRRLILSDPTAMPGLATALSSLALRLAMAGRHLESLPLTREALAVRRTLAEADPAVYLPDLATSLNNLGGVLPGVDRREEALAVTEQAVEIRRRLAQANPHAFRPVLAISLGNLSMRLRELGQGEQAAAVSREVVETRRELATANPTATNQQHLAQEIYNLAGYLPGAQRHEAIALLEEATAMFRILATDRPTTFRPLLAKSLNNLSAALSAAGRNKEALTPIQEAVKIRTELANADPDEYLPDLASALENLATTLANLRRRKQSQVAAARAAAIRSELAARKPGAIAAVRAAVDASRELADADPDEYLPDLAGTLANLAEILTGGGQAQESLAPGREAAELYRRLAEADPALYLRRLAGTLQVMVNALGSLQRLGEAPTWELVAVLRRLAEADPGTYRPALARGLYNLAVSGVQSGEFEAASESLSEAIELYAPLARQAPGEYKAELRAARNLANRLSILPMATAKLQKRMRRHGLRPTLADRLGLTSVPVLAIAMILAGILTVITVLVLLALHPLFLLVRSVWRYVRSRSLS